MSFARPNEPQIQSVDLVERLGTITALLGRSLLRDTVELRVFLEEGLWPVIVDPQDLETALVTLSAHVRDLQSQGAVIDIEARNATIEQGELPDLSREGDFVQLVIRSTGTEPDAHEADMLAEPVLDLGGVDLSSWVSLKNSLHFLQALGGASEVHRDGAAIRIVLYLPRDHDVTLLPSGSAEAPVEPKDAVRDRTEILVVDDEVEVAQALQSMLEEFGYVTRIATDAGQALKSLAARQPSLMLADFVMRGSMDGLMLAREVRQMHPQLPILLMTGNPAPGSPSAGDESSPFPLLHKPILSRDLHAAIQRNLAREADSNVVPLFPHAPQRIR
jgi:CheY-like chemotaxis protein